MSTPLPVSALPKSEKRATSTAFMARLLGKGKDSIEEKSKNGSRLNGNPICQPCALTSDLLITGHAPVPEDLAPAKKRSAAEPCGIYPVDETLQAQLENVNYFVKLPSRELLVRNLLAQAEGAFVVRYSESKRRCLALSVRVPPTHNPACISHYLIVRNQHGYRIKLRQHFPSLQMLITHHSVMPEKLPVALTFVQWNASDWVETYDMHTDDFTHTFSDTDENRFEYYQDNERRIEDFVTPKRRSRIYLDSYRHSRFIDIA
ncbi:SH2 domain protein [Ostertagia ostertagi]